ncbi:MAG: hypothetical protein F2681_17715 [Actinobacteria bacterium]|nr:hypothetical protein [Actinomycetota bacterium]
MKVPLISPTRAALRVRPLALLVPSLHAAAASEMHSSTAMVPVARRRAVRWVFMGAGSRSR